MSQPQDFNIFKIYSKVAEDLQNTNPIISYYLKTYTLNKALEYLKNERSQGKDVSDRTQEIKVWLQDLENLKGHLNTQLGDKEHCQRLFKDFTQNLFQKSDNDYRNANYSRTLARDFLYVSVLFDAWELLGAQTEETKGKKNYSNQARFKIMEALANGTKPMPVPQQNIPNPQPAINQTQHQPQPIQPVHQEKKEPENLVKHDEHVDPMAKINFDLTESIVVPQTSIDKFLNTNAKKAETHPTSDTHLNPNQLNPPNKWGIPVGKSMTIDENAPAPNQHVNQQIPHYDPQFHPPPLTRQKTPPTVFYAPRQHPNLQQESRDDNLKHHILETPGGPSSKIDTPEENVKHYVLETPGGPSSEDQPDLKRDSHIGDNLQNVSKASHQETHHENSQNISKVSQRLPEAKGDQDNLQNQPHVENFPNLPERAHHDNLHSFSQIKPENLQISHRNHEENFQNQNQNLSRISEGPSHSESMSKLEVIPEHNPTSIFENHQSQNLSSVLHESHLSSHQGNHHINSTILENAKPAESIIPQNLEPIHPDIQNKSQAKPKDPSILNSQLHSNPQSVFNPSASLFQSRVPESTIKNFDVSKKLEHENLDPNSQSQAHDSQNDKVLKCKGVKDICLKAIIDLNTTNVKEARQKLQQALQILNEID